MSNNEEQTQDEKLRAAAKDFKWDTYKAMFTNIIDFAKSEAAREYWQAHQQPNGIKVVFIVDGLHRSPEYSPIELLLKSECDILEDMEECTCTFTESNNHCECNPEFECSEVTGYEILGYLQPESDAVEFAEWLRNSCYVPVKDKWLKASGKDRYKGGSTTQQLYSEFKSQS